MPFRFRQFPSAPLLAFVLAFAVPVARAQAPAELPKKEISEAASADFAKFQALFDAKNYSAALALVAQLKTTVPPSSYDAYVLAQIEAQIFLTENKLIAAIAPLERADLLAEGNANFLDAPAHLERLYLLAQLYFQRGTENSDQAKPAAISAASRRQDFEKALVYLRRWFQRATTPSAEVRLFASSLHYNLAVLDPAKVDQARLREAVTHAQEALVLSSKFDNQARLFLVACYLQLGDNTRAAEQLELLAAHEPKNASHWSQLQTLYLNAASSDGADPATARACNLRALLTIERAQAEGHLLSPKDNYTRVAVLFNLQQFTRAAALLEKGLVDGTIEGSKRNWELLSSAYQQTNREDLALDAVGRAVAKFPEDGALEFSLARALYTAGKTADAYARGQAALAKPGVEKPGEARLYLAYLAYELQRYDEAAKWIADARAAGGAPADSIDSLDRAVTEAIAQREALKKS